MTDAAAGETGPDAVGAPTEAVASGPVAASVPLGLIWAQSSDGTIGRDGVMPWHLPEDLAHFKQVTLGAPVVMGRKTWDSLPPRFRPLAGRRNIVVTRQLDWAADGAEVAHSIESALALAATPDAERVWVIGGAELFASVIDAADLLEVTEIDAAFAGDTTAPVVDSTWTLAATDPAASAPADSHTSRTGLRYRFLTYARR